MHCGGGSCLLGIHGVLLRENVRGGVQVVIPHKVLFGSQQRVQPADEGLQRHIPTLRHLWDEYVMYEYANVTNTCLAGAM